MKLTVDENLSSLRQTWTGYPYVITYDDGDPMAFGEPWRAWRLDRPGRVISAKSPDELSAAIRADYEKDPPSLKG